MNPSRRRLLRGAAAGALLWGSPLRLVARAMATALPPRFTVPLPRIAELTGDAIELHAHIADVPILSGAPTQMWTFNGTFPGPIIRRPSGAWTSVTVHNELPPEAGSLSIHRHGGHQASVHDGQPEGSGIEPGSSRTYVYDLTDDGIPERGALEWYHDHSHRRTGRNAWMGLLGLFLLDDGVDAELGLPAGVFDIPLVLTDRSFDAKNQLVDPYAAQYPPPGDEIVGDVVLVNGAPAPYLDVEARRYRFRVLNASNFRIFNLAIEGGGQLVQVGTESGLLPAPVLRDTVPLGPAERAELVVDLSGLAGNLNIVSVPLPGSSYVPRLGATPADLVQLRIAPPTSTDTTTVPTVLRSLPAWVCELSHVPDRVWAFSLGVDPSGEPAWTINGLPFDHERVDARPELGSTETWLFVNAGPVAMSHYIHIHDVDWYVVSRNLAAPEPGEAGLKETFRLDPGEVLLVGARFTDHLGRYMIHCHMLEHEDHGMMATFEVVEPGQGDRPAAASGGDAIAERVRQQVAPTFTSAALAVLDHVGRTRRPAPMAILDRPLPLIVPSIVPSIVCTIDPER